MNNKMINGKILVIGSGGREHAIACKLSQSSFVTEVFVSPGNPGMLGMKADKKKCKIQGKIKCENIVVTDLNNLLSFALKEKIGLTIVGPEVPMSLGIVDLFRKNNLAIVGPTQEASKLETSKAFAKKIMMQAKVPTAGYEEFFNADSAIRFIQSHLNEKMVVKCDGLAAGKGVVVCLSKDEAINAVNALMRDSLLGENVDHIIIEDYLEGVEVSVFALCDVDGEGFTFLGTACDHKRLRDGDLGPNTGGMGVFSPAIPFTEADEKWVNEYVFIPMLKTMKDNGIPFSGILFAGLMKTSLGWKVLEFNVRLGDPETQVLLPLIAEDLCPWFWAAANGSLKEYQMSAKQLSPLKKKEMGIHVVMCAHGYPGTEGINIRGGDEIIFDPDFILGNEDYLFIAGVSLKDHQLVTSGGRVLGITSLHENFLLASENAYKLISQIHFAGVQYRRDIGSRVMR